MKKGNGTKHLTPPPPKIKGAVVTLHIEKLRCEFIDEVQISENKQAYRNGERIKRRYRWRL